MNLLILAANGQIAKIVEKRLLAEDKFKDVSLTLGLRQPKRLADLANNSRVRLLDVDLENQASVNQAVAGQDMIFMAVVDHDPDNKMTRNVISAMKANNVNRIISTNILGIYDEVPGEFGRWNRTMVKNGLAAATQSDTLLSQSGLAYTTLRLPWLNDRDEVSYQITHKNDQFVGVSGSRKSVADLVLKIITDPSLGINDSLGLADPATQGENRPVY
ncbi:NAD(P)H-binding protein [Lentilactobacillus farraginis]|uniref:Oxidoreductase n=1 Tax=Lentilactobacillus farraginis DSM 18382 = JCM 14108 TaxID=1423743 RepID=X0QAA5_9LACO|nr:NAD(P)H-binding protein [Lentilactobacillus farraginis]KRM07406.1 oxidoreductase [Lentilactobacillus farraginis DSM 18382 = JCM 14108]GAF35525.1 oxidoreductase [Lentilactobacillus farraginis DSM 18382 = JCM 14108]